MVHGGRWNPKESIPVLYLALEEDTAIAEMRRAAEKQGVDADELLPRAVTEVEFELIRVLDLTIEDVVDGVGFTKSQLISDDPSACQAIGAAAHYLGFEAMRAKSATGSGEILAIFWDKLLPGSGVSPNRTHELKALTPPGESRKP